MYEKNTRKWVRKVISNARKGNENQLRKSFTPKKIDKIAVDNFYDADYPAWKSEVERQKKVIKRKKIITYVMGRAMGFILILALIVFIGAKLSDNFKDSIVQIAYGTYTQSPQPTATKTPEPYIELACNFSEESRIPEDSYLKVQYPFVNNARFTNTWRQKAIIRNENKVVFNVLPLEVGWYEMILHIDKSIDQSVVDYKIQSGDDESLQSFYGYEDVSFKDFGAQVNETYIPLGIFKFENLEEFDITLYVGNSSFESGTGVTLFVSRLDSVYENTFSSIKEEYDTNEIRYLEFIEWNKYNSENELTLTITDWNLTEIEELPYDKSFVTGLKDFLDSTNESSSPSQMDYLIREFPVKITLKADELIFFQHNLGIGYQCELISIVNDGNNGFNVAIPINNNPDSFTHYPSFEFENWGEISLYTVCWSEGNAVDVNMIDPKSVIILVKKEGGNHNDPGL